MGVYRVAIPAHPPSLNALTRGTIRTRIRLGKAWRTVAILSLGGTVPWPESKRRVSFEIVLGPGQRGCDPDAYFKALGDGLKAAGVIKDDNRKWIEWGPVTFGRAAAPETRLLIEDLP